MVKGKSRTTTAGTPKVNTRAEPTQAEAFFTPRARRTPREESPKMATSPADPGFSLPELGAATRRIERSLADMPTKADIREIVSEVREALQREISGLRTEVEQVEARVKGLEQAAEQAALSPQPDNGDPAVSSAIWRRLDDLDNRSRRHNLRIRGVPEQETALRRYLSNLFNTIVGSKTVSPTDLARAHRALRPQPDSPNAPPRDIVCYFTDFALKDHIYIKARAKSYWAHGGSDIQIFNDISPSTLQARRMLRPITQALRTAGIAYRWGFPLSLSVKQDDIWVTLRTPGEVPMFLRRLNLPELPVPDWETYEFRPPGPSGALPQRRQRFSGHQLPSVGAGNSKN
uniref:Uncharacterized protein n=1 Tax=Leptobrachium leishanense TaxID=445787 RepID=A0A8C5PEA5_9ANUR